MLVLISIALLGVTSAQTIGATCAAENEKGLCYTECGTSTKACHTCYTMFTGSKEEKGCFSDIAAKYTAIRPGAPFGAYYTCIPIPLSTQNHAMQGRTDPYICICNGNLCNKKDTKDIVANKAGDEYRCQCPRSLCSGGYTCYPDITQRLPICNCLSCRCEF